MSGLASQRQSMAGHGFSMLQKENHICHKSIKKEDYIHESLEQVFTQV